MMRCLRLILRRAFLLGLGVCVLGGIALAAPIRAADSKAPLAMATWVPALQVPGDIQAWFPDIAMDSAGIVHMVWNTSQSSAPTTSIQGETIEQDSTVNDSLIYGRFGSPEITRQTDIGVSHGGEAIRNAILVDRDGTLDVLYRSGEHIWFTKAPLSAPVSASAFSEPHWISGTGTAYYTAIAQDVNGALHVVYTENVPVDGDPLSPQVRRQSLFYRRSSDGGATWSTPLRLSSTTTLRGTTRPQVRVNGTTVVVAWDEGYDNITAKGDPAQGGLRRSLDGGRTWQPIQVIADPDGPIEQVTFAFGKENHALLVWRETGKQVMRYSASENAGATWGDPVTVPNIVARPYVLKHQFDRYALTVDSTGAYHLLAVGQIGGPDELALFHLELRDGVWSAAQSVYSGQGLPEYPGIATDGGNRMVVSFFVRDSLFEIGNYRIWRVSGTIAAPPVAPRPVPTVAPTATPALRIATPRVNVATPTLSPGAIEPENRARIDRPPGIISFGTGMLVVGGLVGAVVLARLWWVRRY